MTLIEQMARAIALADGGSYEQEPIRYERLADAALDAMKQYKRILEARIENESRPKH